MSPDTHDNPKRSEECWCRYPAVVLTGKWRWLLVLGVLTLIAVCALLLKGMLRPSTTVTINYSPELVGTSIRALSELDTQAREMNAVFVFIPAKGVAPTASTLAAIKGAKQSLEIRFDIKIGLFTLIPGSRDYEEMAAQISVPGLVPIVKTGAKKPISGDLTESKIVDAFMVAVATGGCCPLGYPSESR